MSSTSGSEINMHGGLPRSRNPTGHSMTSLQKISLAITGTMEKFFYRWGYTVATHPYKFIGGCLLLTFICGLGLINFTQENRPDKLWIPRESEFALNTEWLRENFPSPIRNSWALVTADNVLVPEVMRAVINIHERVKQIVVSDGKKWDDICFKLPITKSFLRRRRKRSSPPDLRRETVNETRLVPQSVFEDFEKTFDDDFFTSGYEIADESENGLDPMLSIPEDIYCSIVNELEEACWEINPAEMWSFNRSQIENLTHSEIIRVMNHQLTSPVFGRKVNYTVDFGGHIEKNDKGEIIKAGSLVLRWSVGINQTVLERGKAGSDGTGEVADESCLEWEREWTLLMKNISAEMPKGINIYFHNSQSWSDISEATLFDDSLILAMGFGIMFCYVGLMLGRFNMIEQRPFLTMAGLSCVGLAAIISYGVCSLCFIVYGPVNKILPFLLLGIGIDDMFVIMQCWTNLFPSTLTTKSKLSIPERMGMALKHAGVSITVTSLTDVAAFGVGALTILPGLQSFCIYAAIGIIAIFVFQATYFVAWFAIDQKRVEERRNAFFPWIKYKEEDFIPNKWSDKSYAQHFFENILSKYLFTKWATAFVILITGGFLGVSIYGNVLLRQEFDPMWFLPNDSYMSQYVQKRDAYYPGVGYPAFIVAHKVNWSSSFKEFDAFMEDFKESGTLYNFESWYEDFKDYANKNFKTDIPNTPLSQSKFQKYMGKFLYSPSGSKHRAHFKVDGNFTCGSALPEIKTVIMPFRFRKFHGPEEHIPGLNKVKSLVKNSNLTFFKPESKGKLFPWGTGLVAWETDEIINAELYRNVALSLICVLITTFLLLANFRVCFFCGLCVIFTVINVGGFMHFWGLTIDTVSCIDIVLGIGLCVDYAAHIALAFMTCTGSRVSRACQALKNIGPAVLNGGFSTFLAIVLLANSQSHAFQSFFKIFSIVIAFGLFHGLIFLPVLLSLFGPDPYPFAYNREEDFESMDQISSSNNSSKPKCVEMQPLSVNSLIFTKEQFSSNNEDGLLGKDSLFEANDPLLNQATCQSKQI